MAVYERISGQETPGNGGSVLTVVAAVHVNRRAVLPIRRGEFAVELLGHPGVEPVGVGDGHVDAAMTARETKAIMPVRAVQGAAIVKEHCPGDFFQVIE